MAQQFIYNIILAFLYMCFNLEFTVSSFVVGFFWGIILLFIFRHHFKTMFYLIYLWKWFKLIMMFTWELIKADIAIFKLILKPNLSLQQHYIQLPLTVKKNWEIVLLANMITLTPGTLTTEVSSDNKYLLIHCVNTDDPVAEIKGIKESFERAILEVHKS